MASNDVNAQNDLKQRVLSESEVLQLGKDLAYILQKREKCWMLRDLKML